MCKHQRERGVRMDNVWGANMRSCGKVNGYEYHCRSDTVDGIPCLLGMWHNEIVDFTAAAFLMRMVARRDGPLRVLSDDVLSWAAAWMRFLIRLVSIEDPFCVPPALGLAGIFALLGNSWHANLLRELIETTPRKFCSSLDLTACLLQRPPLRLIRWCWTQRPLS